MPCICNSANTYDKIVQIRLEDEPVPEEVPPLWSRRQAELFIARQTTWLQNNESAALPPPRLQDVIRQVLQANPDHYEAVSSIFSILYQAVASQQEPSSVYLLKGIIWKFLF